MIPFVYKKGINFASPYCTYGYIFCAFANLTEPYFRLISNVNENLGAKIWPSGVGVWDRTGLVSFLILSKKSIRTARPGKGIKMRSPTLLSGPNIRKAYFEASFRKILFQRLPLQLVGGKNGLY